MRVYPNQVTLLPWYMYPKLTCRVLNKIANRVSDNEVCKDLMDKLTMRLWSKQEAYYVKFN